MNVKYLVFNKLLYFLQRNRHSQRFTRTDMMFFCIFPVLFLLFNLIYWWSVFSWRRDTWEVHNTPDRYSLGSELGPGPGNIDYTGTIVGGDTGDTGAL